MDDIKPKFGIGLKLGLICFVLLSLFAISLMNAPLNSDEAISLLVREYDQRIDHAILVQWLEQRVPETSANHGSLPLEKRSWPAVFKQSPPTGFFMQNKNKIAQIDWGDNRGHYGYFVTAEPTTTFPAQFDASFMLIEPIRPGIFAWASYPDD